MTVHCTFDSQSFECWQVGLLLSFVGEMKISLSLRQIWRDWSRFSAPNRSFRGSERQQQHNNNIDNITCVCTRQTHQSSSSWQCYLTQKKLLFNRKTRYNYTLCSTVWKMSHLSLLGWKTQTTPQTTATTISEKTGTGNLTPSCFLWKSVYAFIVLSSHW